MVKAVRKSVRVVNWGFIIAFKNAAGPGAIVQGGGVAMRAIAWVIMLLCGSLAGSAAAWAYDAPTFVIPGKRGVPVVINGYDASNCLVEGDWGLARPGHVEPTIIACPLLNRGRAAAGGYFPGNGRRPGYGRKEIEPPADRRLPPPAPSFNREWLSGSDPLPATIEPPAEYPPLIVAPELTRRRRAAHPPQ